MGYARPGSLQEALRLAAEGGWIVLAGGTDIFPASVERPLSRPVLDVTGITELEGIRREKGHWRIGAAATWSDVVNTELPPAFQALQQAGREIGSVQIQNRATLAGNLCNASPAADGAPPLLALGAIVELQRAGTTRRVDLASFIRGNRKTALEPGEMLTAILVPEGSARGVSHFVKLGARRYLVISIAMVAVRIVLGEDRRIEEAALAVGACGPMALRLPMAEAALRGAAAEVAASRVKLEHLQALSPIDDLRGGAEYRREATLTAIRRGIDACLAAP
jgi:CO/xanthine dehydrogenase FAD-binding subunit